jgi:phosphohistidine phosphatase
LKLYVMRHGPAQDAAESGADGDRALSASGRERVKNVAKTLLDAREAPQSIFTSPLVRAAQTAEIVAIITNLGDRAGTVEVRREVAPGGSAVGLVRSLALERKRRVMLVGHEPDLSALVSTLLGETMGSIEKAMVIGLHVPSKGGAGRLRFVLEPKTLRVKWGPGASPG